jgi:cell division protein FtsA
MHPGFLKGISMKNEKLVVGLDVGTTKTCVIVGEVSPGNNSESGVFSNRVNIIGIGTASSTGIKKGVITNIEYTVESIMEAVQEAEGAAGVDIKAVHVGITGGHIDCLSSHGVIAVKEKEIGQKEVDNVMDAAKAVAIPFEREMLHVIPVGFTVNGQNGITDPRGMGGVRLETNVRIITGATTSIQNLIRSCQKAGLDVIDIIFQPLASAEAVLTRDEKDLGVAVIDIGSGTTDVALFHEGNICHSAVLAIGGGNFTNDIAVGLRIPTREAERIKKKNGCAMMSCVKDDEEIAVGFADGQLFRKIPRRYLVEILQPRAEELFGLLKDEITGKGFHKIINSGVVLTGGAVLMAGMDVMAENILELPVRIGFPAGIGGVADVKNNPAFAAGTGLMLYGAEESLSDQGFDSGNILARMRGWFGEMLKLRN